MAEFCLDCWNKINNSHDSHLRYALSWHKDLCEECGQWKRVIVTERLWSRFQRSLTEIVENIKSNNPEQE